MAERKTISKVDIVKSRRQAFVALCQDEIKRREAVLQSMLRLESGIHPYANALNTLKIVTERKGKELEKPIVLPPGPIIVDYPELYSENFYNDLTVKLYKAVSITQDRSLTDEERSKKVQEIRKVIPGFNFALIVDLGDEPPVLLFGGNGHKELSDQAEGLFGDSIFQIMSGVVVIDGQHQVFQIDAFTRLAPDWTKYDPSGTTLKIRTWGAESGRIYQQNGEIEYKVLGPNCKSVVRVM